ncbi:ABC transporter permease [Gemmobacter sp.]|uniref:ABC transporter permease n=1 Tax=Gemmobacter sp. TaxID=1898957 RepID=UPI002AFE2D8A|nr:ABC transporter permease [Gemmobacter sp.]
MTATGTELPDQPVKLPDRGPRPRAAARTIVALMLREMSTRYGRSPGGYIWAIVEPLAGILLLSIAFSMLMRSPPLGSSFVLFKATGMMPFMLYMTISGSIGHALHFSRPLLQYPGVTWLDAIVARFTLNTLTSILVTYLILTGILVWTGTRTVLDMGDIGLAIGLAALLGLGIGVLNSYLSLAFPVWDQAWAILNRPLFLISGILFLYEDSPKLIQDILWWNPLVHIIGLMRAGFYPMYYASYVSVIYVLTCALLPLVAGLLLLHRHHLDLLNR